MNTETIINNLINAILNQNADSAAELLSDEVVFKDPMSSTSGKKNVHEMYKGFFEAASSIEWDIKQKIIHGNVAVIERVNHITLKNGKMITLPIVTIAEVDQGKIKCVRDYFDVKTFTDQLA